MHKKKLIKKNQALEKMDKFLAMMEAAAKDNSKPTPNFTKGTD